MPKTPPHDDEQADYQQTPPPPQRRRRSPTQRPQPEPRVFHSDEHPEIPKIRRASLQLEQDDEAQSIPPVPKRRQGQAKRVAEEEQLESTQSAKLRTVPSTTNKIERVQSSKLQAVPSTTNKISVTKRPTPAAYQPPPAQHIEHTRRKHPIHTGLSRLEQNQNLLIIGTILLVLLIIGPILIGIAQNKIQGGAATATSITSGSTATPQSGVQPAADPREIVIMPQDTDHPAPPVLATSAYLLDADTGTTLYAYNPFMHLPMLSTTKLMTAILAIEQGNLDQKITINDAIDHDLSQLSADSALFGIKKGETYTLRDLLYGLLLVSGNDAAIAIADALGGTQQKFVDQMNQRAQQLGLIDTHYMNPHGLLATGQYSSAHDLAVLGRYSMSLAQLRQISGTQQYHIAAGGNHPARDIINGNQFLWWYPGVDGGKPGWDGADNFVQVISCVRNNHHLIGVVMHTNDWWTDMRDLMNWGFDNFNWISPYDVDLHQPIPYDYLWNYFAKDKKENTIPTADQGRYYIYTGFSITGPILSYYDKSGGLGKFGYPTGMLKVSSSQGISQQFEHGTIQCDSTGKQCSTV